MESLPFDCLRIIASMVGDTVPPSREGVDSHWFSHDYFYRLQKEEYNQVLRKEYEQSPGSSIQVGRLFRQISKSFRTIVDTSGFYSSIFSTEALGVQSRLLVNNERLMSIPLSIYQTDRVIVLKDSAHLRTSLYRILSTVTNLQILYLSTIIFPLSSFIDGLRCQRGLTKLYVNHTVSINDQVIERMVHSLPCNLTDIDISDTGLRAYPSGTNEDGTINITLPSVGTTASSTTTTNSSSTNDVSSSSFDPSSSDTASDTTTNASISSSSTDDDASVVILPLTDLSLFHIQRRYGSTLLSLHLAGCPYVTDNGIRSILQHCPNLQDLDISRNYLLQGTFLPYLFQPPLCSNLVRLNLSSIGSSKLTVEECYQNALIAFQSSVLSDECSSTIALDSIGTSSSYHRPSPLHTLTKLQYLDVSWCPWLRDDCLEALLTNRLPHATEIRHLSLHACTKLSTEGIVHLRRWSGLAYVEYLDIGQLNTLDDTDVALLLSRYHGRHTSLTPVRNRSRSNSHPDGNISSSSSFTSSSSSSSVSRRSTGSSSSPSLLPNVATAALLSESMHYPSFMRLHTLDISGISRVSTKTFTAIGKHCPNLLRLKCRLNVLVNHKCFEAWFSSIDRKYNLHDDSLRLTSMAQVSMPVTTTEENDDDTDSNTDDDHDDDEDDDDDDDDANDNYDVSEYRDGDGTGLRSTHQSYTFPSYTFASLHLPLTHLDLWRCLELDNQSLMDIGKVCPYLTHIDIEGADVNLSDNGICALLRSCPLLVHVSLASCTTTDRTLKTIAKYNPKLVYLDISGGLEYTTEGLTILFRHLPMIQVLKLYKLGNINDTTIYTLVKYCRNLRCLTLRSCGMMDDSQEWIGMNVLGIPTLTSTIDSNDVALFERIRHYFYPRNDNSSPSSSSWSPDRLSRTSFTLESLFLLGQIALAPNGHLTTLGLSFIPTLTVYHYYVFIRFIILQDSCSISILKFAEGITTQNLELLVTLLEQDTQRLNHNADTPAGIRCNSIASSSVVNSTTTNQGASVRMRRYTALSKLEYLIPNVRIEWRG